jgi:hypothetical protein
MQSRGVIAGILIVLLCYFNIISLSAQIVNIESQRIQSDSVRHVLISDVTLTLRETDGESFRAIQTNLTTQYKSKNYKNLWLFVGGIDYSALNETRIADNHLLHLRFNRKWGRRLRIEGFQQIQSSPLTGIAFRSLSGTGPRLKVQSGSQIAAYFGSLYMFEWEKVIGSEANIGRFHRLSTYLSGSWRSRDDNREFSCIGYYQPNLGRWRDYRLSFQSVLSIKIIRHFSLTANLSLSYDAEPPPGFIPFTLVNTYGLRLNL